MNVQFLLKSSRKPNFHSILRDSSAVMTNMLIVVRQRSIKASESYYKPF